MVLSFARAALLLGLMLGLIGCGDDVESLNEDQKPGAYTVFDPDSGDIPYPNGLLFSDSEDGTLNLPYTPGAADAPVIAALNALDGFSTTSPITLSLTAPVDDASLAAGVHLFEVKVGTVPGGIPAVTDTEAALVFGTDYTAYCAGTTLVILPLRPLDGDSGYMVVITDAVTDTDGAPLAADATTAILNAPYPLVDENGAATVYFHPDDATNTATATQLEGMRQLNQFMIKEAVEAGIARDRIVITWSFKTQTLGSTARAFSDHNATATLTAAPSGLTASRVIGLLGEDNSTFTGNADLYAGTLAGIPYYLGIPSVENPTAPLSASFTYSEYRTLPVVRDDNHSIPVLLSVPNDREAPEAGWPVVIFLHGILENRMNLIALAESLASVGYAAVAIDLPLHGVTDTSSPFYAGGLERTFNLDLIGNDTLSAGSDDLIDPTGVHFLNLTSMLTARDNLRQVTSDLIALRNSLYDVQGIDLDPTDVSFVGHSLGSISAFGFLAHRPMQSTTLAMPGGGIARLLAASEMFGPLIEATLAANGIVSGSAEYEAFLTAVQAIIDDADALNMASAVALQQSLLVIMAENDTVIPNSVTGAPLAGGEPLLGLLGTRELDLSAAPGLLNLPRASVSRFAEPVHHASFLLPTYSPASTVEMQTQTASFIQSRAAQLLVSDPSLMWATAQE